MIGILKNVKKPMARKRKKEGEMFMLLLRVLLGNHIRVVILPESEHHRLQEHDSLL